MKCYKTLAFYLLLFSNVVCSQSILRKTIPDMLVALTFDDAVKSHYSYVAPLLKKYGFGASFFVCEFPPDFSDTSKYMTWQQIQQLAKWGFDIANHTHHHVHVNGLTHETLTEEIAYIERKCDSLKIQKPINFAYPGYATAEPAIKVLLELGYLTARAGGERLYHPQTDNPLLIPSFTPGNDLQKAMDAIKQAKDGAITILTIHGVPDNAHVWLSTDPKVFETYVRYLKDNNYKVISMRGLQEYINFKGTAVNWKVN